MSGTIIVKNNTGSPLFIEDMGLEIPGSGQRTLSDLFSNTFYVISNSDSLKVFVTSGDITINNGIVDLSIEDALEFLTPSSIYDIPKNITQFPEVPTLETGKLLKAQDSTSCIWIEPKFGGTGGNVYSFGDQNQPGIQVKSTSWYVIGQLIFRGGDELGIPTGFKTIVTMESASTIGQIRLYDYTNGQVICSIPDITNIVPAIRETNVLNNIPTGQAIFEIQAITNNKSNFMYIYSTLLVFA